eukprot:4859907-Amphidinium_carterae.1
MGSQAGGPAMRLLLQFIKFLGIPLTREDSLGTCPPSTQLPTQSSMATHDLWITSDCCCVSGMGTGGNRGC